MSKEISWDGYTEWLAWKHSCNKTKILYYLSEFIFRIFFFFWWHFLSVQAAKEACSCNIFVCRPKWNLHFHTATVTPCGDALPPRTQKEEFSFWPLMWNFVYTFQLTEGQSRLRDYNRASATNGIMQDAEIEGVVLCPSLRSTWVELMLGFRRISSVYCVKAVLNCWLKSD